MAPHLHEPAAAPAAPAAAADAAPAFPSMGNWEPRGMTDLEKKADDIIANFRARHQTGFDRWY